MHQYQSHAIVGRAVAAQVGRREKFIVKTYNHLFVAILAFIAIEIGIFKANLALPIAQTMLSGGWIMVLGGFMIVSWLASRVAMRSNSLPKQYAALGGFVLAEAVIFVPLLLMAEMRAPGAIQSAGMVTIAAFAGLTGVVFVTRKDFSFLGGILRYAFICALVLIGASLLFGFNLGTFFSVGMVALAGAAILYDTSNVLRNFPEDRYVAASLQLFASVALMFWYVLRLFIGSRN